MICASILLLVYTFVLLYLSSFVTKSRANEHMLQVLGRMQVGYDYHELDDGKIEYVIKKKWFVNLVLSISEDSVFPRIPVVDQRRVVLQQVFFVVSNKTYERNRNAFAQLGDSVNVTITNFVDDHDYLPVLLSFYYKSDASIIVKVNGTNEDDIAEELSQFIMKSYYAQDFDKVVVTGTMKSMGNRTSFICMTNSALRRLIMGTNITFSSPSLFSGLLGVSIPTFPWTHVHLPSTKPLLMHPVVTPIEEIKCFPLEVTQNSTITVFIRTYQRNYLQRQIAMLLKQSKPPQIIIVVQNRNLVDLSYETLIHQVGKNVKLIYVWNYNWNAFFHLSYMISGLMPTDFSFTFDDDQLLSNPLTHERALSVLEKEPAIYSMRKWCWCKKFYSNRKMLTCERQCSKNTDLVVNPFYSYSSVAKYMWRYDIPTYYCCEEMSYLLAARIECGIKWHFLSMKYESYQRDNKDRSKDNYTIALKKRVNWERIEHDAMYYYTNAGYKPEFRYDPRFLHHKKTLERTQSANP